MERDMENIYEYDNEERNADEGFKVENLNEANWCFRKIKSKKEKEDEIMDLYNKEMERLQEWKEREVGKIRDEILFFEGLIGSYLIREKEKDPKFKISTPYGTANTRKSQKEYIYIGKGEEFIKWAKENEHLELIRVKEEPNKSEVKEVFELNGSELVDPETGEIVKGIDVQEKPDTLNIKIK